MIALRKFFAKKGKGPKKEESSKPKENRKDKKSGGCG